MNEELETSKREVQSVYEALSTVNTEHQKKIEEQSTITNDLNKLLASTGIGLIVLDVELHIRPFTPAALDFVNLIASDVVRPLNHLASKIEYDRFIEDAKAVLKTLVPRETEVQIKEGKRYAIRMRPYRTLEGVIDGVVVTFVEIDRLKTMERQLKQSQYERVRVVEERTVAVEALRNSKLSLRGVFNAMQKAVFIASHERVIKEISAAAEKTFGVSREELVGQTSELIQVGQYQYLEYGKRIREALRSRDMAEIDLNLKRKGGEVFPVSGTIHLLRDERGSTVGWFNILKEATRRNAPGKRGTPDQ